MGSILRVLTTEERNCAEKIMVIQGLSFIDLGWQKILWPDVYCFCVLDSKEDGSQTTR